MLLESVDERNRELLVDHFFERYDNQLEVAVYFAFHAVSAESDVDVSLAAEKRVVLIERIVEALVELVEIQEDYSAAHLHCSLHCVDVVADLFVLEICRELRAENSQWAPIEHELVAEFFRRG